MATGEAVKGEERSWPAIVGWGSLGVFSLLFVWLISTQLGESWAKREPEAMQMVKDFKPDGKDSLADLTKIYSITAKEKDGYVGEFTWDSKQREGPEYEVSLLWKEGNAHHVALWRVDLKSKEIRPQGDEASSLPRRAREGDLRDK
jgi:hypothetical protein